MSEDTLSRLYPQLASAERFQLWMLAQGRGDEADAERLIATCPRYEYRMDDQEFRARIDVARDLVTALMGDSNRAFGYLSALQILGEQIAPLLDELVALSYLARRADTDGSDEDDDDGSVEDGEDAAEDEEEDTRPEWERDPFEATRYPTATMELMHRMQIAIIAAQWDAFATVCRQEMELEPETVLETIWPGLLARFEALRPELDGRQPLSEKYDPYEEARDEFQAAAIGLWRKGTGAA